MAPGSRRAQTGAQYHPDAIALHRLLVDFLREKAGAAAMEVSSIGLDQGRVNGARFDLAIHTNLTRDHLDYHGSMERYAEAKAKLFEFPTSRPRSSTSTTTSVSRWRGDSSRGEHG